MAAERRNARKKNKKGKMVLLICEVCVLLVAIVGLLAIWKLTDKKTGIQKYRIEEPEVNSEVKHRFETDLTLQKYTNIALFGVDARNGVLEKGTRTDTIMICCINNETGDIRLTSVYRDTYLNLGNDTYNKCNAAYAKGGYEQAINMLNMNMDLYITDFVTVGFEGVIKTIDALGGVEIDVQQNEISHLNNYQASMYCTEENPNNFTTNYVAVTDPGLQTFSGYQALAYCRIRYTAGNDFRRTERQREVLKQILEKAKKASPTTLSNVAKEVMPLVATSLDIEDILAMAGNVTRYNIGETKGFPFADHITTGKIPGAGDSVIPITLEENVILLHEYLYPGVEYSPSEDVINYSNKIRNDTSPYVGQ